MSRSNPTLTNPATRFFEWSGSKGQLEFYDKEKKERINVPLPFEFLPLDELSTITGFSARAKSSYWSNEVRNIKNDTLTVRSKNGVEQEGTYDTLADVRAKGAKYAKSIYIMYKTREGWQIGNIKAHGSALSSWIEFSGTCKPQNGKVTVTKGDVLQTPKGDDYYPPVFEYGSADYEENGIAMDLDRELQVYLNQYLAAAQFNRGQEDGEDKPEPTTIPTADGVVIEDVEDSKEGTRQAVRNWEKVGKGESAKGREDDEAVEKYQKTAADSFAEEPINLDDIPF